MKLSDHKTVIGKLIELRKIEAYIKTPEYALIGDAFQKLPETLIKQINMSVVQFYQTQAKLVKLELDELGVNVDCEIDDSL